MKLKALIVDDEDPARDKLRSLLSSIPDVRIVGEAADGRAALELVEKCRPDILFLDIQIPNLNGMEVSRRLPRSAKVIFTTAHAQYAVDAFEAGSVDYLLKPWSRDRLLLAMDRLRQQWNQERSASFLKQSLPALPLEAVLEPASDSTREKLIFRSGERLSIEATANIMWVSAEGNYLSIRALTQRYFVRGTMERIRAELDPKLFVRVHRSSLINVNHVRTVSPSERGALEVLMDDGTQLKISRARVPALLAALRKLRIPVLGLPDTVICERSELTPDRRKS
jgi:two-component system LytT family response regulator